MWFLIYRFLNCSFFLTLLRRASTYFFAVVNHNLNKVNVTEQLKDGIPYSTFEEEEEDEEEEVDASLPTIYRGSSFCHTLRYFWKTFLTRKTDQL